MLFEQLNNAIAKKNHITNNRNAYHYEVQIETKHKIDYDLGRWFRAKYEYRVHTELRFDHNRYNNDLQQADQEINNLQNQINNEIQSLESQLNSLVSQKNSDSSSLYYAQNQLNNVSYQLSSTNSTIQNLRNSISEYRNQYSELTRRHADLNSQIENKNRTNSSISNQIQNTSAQISSIGSEIELKIQAENQAKSQLQSIKQSSQNLSIQIQNLDREIRELVTSSNEQQRALLFSDCYLNPDLREISEAIELIGFDVDYLAYLGVKQNNSQLVRFAIEKDVDFTSTSIKEIENKTLLQYAAQNNCVDIISLILNQEGLSLDDTLLNAMNQNDITTIEKVFGYENGKFASTKIYGYTLLHIAIDAGQKDVVEKILEVSSAAINDISDNGDNAFKITVRTKNVEVINIIASKIDIEAEAVNFIESDNLVWLEEIIKYGLLSRESKINVLHKANSNLKFDAVKMLLESDSTIDFEYHQEQDLNHQESYHDVLQLENINSDISQNLLGQESILNLQQNPEI